MKIQVYIIKVTATYIWLGGFKIFIEYYNYIIDEIVLKIEVEVWKQDAKWFADTTIDGRLTYVYTPAPL